MDFTGMKNYMERLTNWVVPGNSIVVYRNNEKVFEWQTGYADLENRIPMNKEHLFNGYSVSKVITVTAAMQLYEKGFFLLDDPLYEYLPEYRLMSVKYPDGTIRPAENFITMRQLFTMTAGFRYRLDVPAIKNARKLTEGRMDTRTVIRCLAEEPLEFEPGTQWKYSLCHDVLAAAVEVISGKRFSRYVQENILDPVGMTDTCYHNEPVRNRMAEQYQCLTSETPDLSTLQARGITSVDGVMHVGKGVFAIFGPEYDSGGGGVTTSVDDYGRFASALANGGIAPSGERILSSSSVELLRTNQLTEEIRKQYYKLPQLYGYGYGLGVRTMMDRAASGSLGPVGEFGWGGAAGATLLSDPENRLAMFYAEHMLNPQEAYYMPRLRNVLYSCLD